MSLDIYQENILDHYENPRNFGHVDGPDVKAHDTNPLCGDVFDMEIRFKGDKISDIRFSGHGCAISTASASMLTDKIKTMRLNEIKKLDTEDIKKMLGVELSHVRIKCAMLPLKVLKLGLYEYIDKKTQKGK
jgi:nitrogen fixation protein NifU and related proteins